MLFRSHWFSFPNDLLLHPDFAQITGDEFKWFVWVVCVCSKCKSEKIRLDIDHGMRFLNLSKESLFSMIKKLEKKQVLTKSAAASRPHGGRKPTSTEHNITEHNITEHIQADFVKKPAGEIHELICLWNEHATNLSKVNLTNKKREQKIKNIWQNLKPEQWLQVIKKINASDFCCGKSSTGWRATFDWLLQPETYLKVLEGKYDNRQTGKGYNNQRADVDQEFEQIIRGDHDNA